MATTTTNAKQAQTVLKRAKRCVRTANKWRSSAEKVLYWAKCSVDHPGDSAYNDRALDLVHRCFKVKDHTFDFKIKQDLDKIKRVFRNVAGFYRAVLKAKGYKFLTVGPSNSFDDKGRPLDNAYAQVGGWKRGDSNGITFVVERVITWNETELTDLITHEAVHFAGGIDHHYIDGNRNNAAYGTKVFKLTNEQSKKNASSYSYLAYLARMPHTRWLTAT